MLFVFLYYEGHKGLVICMDMLPGMCVQVF